MGARIGTLVRLEIDTTPAAAATYKKINHETEMSDSFESDVEDVISKDTGGWKDALKTFMSGEITVSAIDDNVNGTNLDYEAVRVLEMEQNTDTYQGRRRMRMISTVPGTETAEFVGIITSVERGNNASELATFSFKVRIVTRPTFTAVV